MKLLRKLASRSQKAKSKKIAASDAKVLVHIGAFRAEDRDQIIRDYAAAQGVEYYGIRSGFGLAEHVDVIKNASLVALWNGWHNNGPLVTKICRLRNIPLFYFERGMLPQNSSFFIDPKGFCGDSILNSDLSWITAQDKQKLQTKREELLKQHPRKDEGFTLVTLQLENDSQILYNTPYRSMKEFVEYIENEYSDRNLVIRPHPKDGVKYTSRKAKVTNEGNFMDWACRAKEVVGLTSTCLYEAGVLGVPVIALGDHPLHTHAPDLHDDVLAGILALTLPKQGGDLAAILERFSIRCAV